MRLFTSIRPEPIRKKNNFHIIYHITWDVPQNYCMYANNKEKFRIVGLKGRSMKFKASEFEGRLTSLRVLKEIFVFADLPP